MAGGVIGSLFSLALCWCRSLKRHQTGLTTTTTPITTAQLAQSAILHQVGARVLIHSLVSNTELNGLHGRVSAVSPDGACYIVEVENVPTGESRRAFEFSGKNLAAVGAAADAASAPSPAANAADRETAFEEGSRVMLHSLSAYKAELNGRVGSVVFVAVRRDDV